jgi:hypothetical protein
VERKLEEQRAAECRMPLKVDLKTN